MKHKLLSTILAIAVVAPTAALSQQFSILEAGELVLGEDRFSAQGRVTENLGVRVLGIGEAFIRISAGAESSTRPFTFRVASSRLSSFYFPNDLAATHDVFRRGILGEITFDILASDGTLQASTQLLLDVKLPKKNCTKKSTVPCKRFELAKVSRAQRIRFLKRLISSIRGPIVLEP